MSHSLVWQNYFSEQVIVLFVFTISYLIFYYWFNAEKISSYLPENEERQKKSVLWQRFFGGIILGLPPLVTIFFLSGEYNLYGLNLNNFYRSLNSAFFLTLFLLPILYFSAKKEGQQAVYPQIRSREWTPQLYGNSVFSWSIYLTGYEFMFRGFLLFSLADIFGSWPAIAVTTSLYVLVHFNKPAGETIGCIPIGIIFGMIALSTGSFVGPLIAHILIASFSELFAIINNPEMEFK